jgi:hypothetical protein
MKIIAQTELWRLWTPIAKSSGAMIFYFICRNKNVDYICNRFQGD